MNLEEMNFEEFKKEVLIYNISFSKFKKYYNNIFSMLNIDNQKAIAYAEILSYANVTYTKHEMVRFKKYLASLEILIQKIQLDEVDDLSANKLTF